MKGQYIFLAEGFEETEALGTIDILRRGGIEIKTVSVYGGTRTVTGSHGISINTDLSFLEFKEASAGKETGRNDIMVFPGGMPGASNLADTQDLMEIMKAHYSEGGSIAAICAAPSVVLQNLGNALKGKEITCYEGFQEPLENLGAEYTAEGTACADEGRLITGRGPGYTLPFALKVLEHLTDAKTAEKVSFDLYLKTV